MMENGSKIISFRNLVYKGVQKSFIMTVISGLDKRFWAWSEKKGVFKDYFFGYWNCTYLHLRDSQMISW